MNQKPKFEILGLIFLIIFCFYFFYKLTFVPYYRLFLLDDFNLLIHEAGHLLSVPFGNLINILGGTITQLAFPSIFLVYFLLKKDLYGIAFSSFWLGENFINVSVYVKDAQIMNLPLVGGGEHDWNILLSRWVILSKSGLVGNIFSTIGCLFLFLSIFILIYRLVQIIFSN